MADYMLYALERESTRVISLFLETVRDPESFKLALETAAERDVPVVALKVGRTPPAGWSRPTPARWPGTTPPTKPCSTRTAWPASGRSTRWPTCWSSSERDAAPHQEAWPPSSTPAESGRTWSTPQQTWKSPSPGPPKRP